MNIKPCVSQFNTCLSMNIDMQFGSIPQPVDFEIIEVFCFWLSYTGCKTITLLQGFSIFLPNKQLH